METSERIKRSFERNRRALSLKPGIGRGTATARAQLVEGLLFTVEDGAWKFHVDMSEKSGGTGAAPDPGVYGRTALASCLGINYAQQAAARSLRITRLEVVVEADYDSNGTYGTLDQPPGYRRVRYRVAIEADATDEEIQRFVEEADKLCPYLDNFSRAIEVRRELEITANQG